MPEYLPGQQMNPVTQRAVQKAGKNPRADRDRYRESRIYYGTDGKAYTEDSEQNLHQIGGTTEAQLSTLKRQAAMIQQSVTNVVDDSAFVGEALSLHVNDTNNPHQVTAAQLGITPDSNLPAHLADYNNPHQVTATQIGAIPTTAINQPNGVAGLDSNGILASAVIPPRTTIEHFHVANEAEMLALNAQLCDFCSRADQFYTVADLGGMVAYATYQLILEPASNLNNWQLVGGPGSVPIVTMVNGQVGNVQINFAHSIVLTAIGGTPTANTSAVTLNTDKMGVDFADATAGTCSYYVVIPPDYTSGGFTAQFITRNTGTGSGNVTWGIRLYVFADGDATTLPTATTQTVTMAIAAGKVNISSASGVLNPANLAAGRFAQIDIYRDGAAASDTFTGAIELIAVLLTYTS